MSSVSSKKYKRLKSHIREWHAIAANLKDKIEDLTNKNENFERENEDLTQDKSDLLSKCNKLTRERDTIVEKYEELKSRPPLVRVDNTRIDELKSENRDTRDIVKQLRRQLKDTEERECKNTFSLQKDVMLKEGKIQQLEDALESLKHRYTDLYEEYRDQRRWEREGKRHMVAID